MPASRSRSASRTLWFMPAQFGRHVTDQRGGAAAALGGHEAEGLAPAFGSLAPPAAFRASAVPALRSGSCSGGYRYSLMPARSDERIASDSAVVFSAMIIGSPAAARIEATRPSRGSFQPLISTSTTSGRMRSRRSRKLLDIADILVFDDDAERQVGEAWPAPAPRVPGFRSPVRWSADTCGVSPSPYHFAGAAGRRLPVPRPGLHRRRRGLAAPARIGLAASGPAEPPGLPCAADQLFDRHASPLAASPAPARSCPYPAARISTSLFFVMNGIGHVQRRAAAVRRESAAPLPA